MVAGLVPWLLTGWHGASWSIPVRVVGGVLLAMGAVVLVQSFVRFVVEGRGTPAPIAPTERLVVGGLYRHVRNPMYVGVVAAIVGQALLLGRVVLLVYAGNRLGDDRALRARLRGADTVPAVRRVVRRVPPRRPG